MVQAQMQTSASAGAQFHAMGIRELQAGLAAREFSAHEVACAALDRIAARDKDVHAFLETTEQLALDAAAAVDAALAQGKSPAEIGPLAGVPVAYKDNMNLLGTRTTCSSRMLENYVSPYTATCVQRTLDAGALPLGKLNMDEFAFGSSTETSAFGPTCNPWDLTCVPGGSSGGSAAAVAAGLAMVTLGSDTGGSIRQPGSFTGTVAVKPTYGVVSRYGIVAFGSSLDQVGPFARSVEDAALALNAIAGHDPLDCTSQPVDTDFTANLAEGAKGMRVGIVPEFMDAEGLTAEVKARVEEAAAHLQAAGAELVEVDLPNAQAAMSAYYVLGPCEAFSNLSRFDSVRYGYCDPGHKDLGGQYDDQYPRHRAGLVFRRRQRGQDLLHRRAEGHLYRQDRGRLRRPRLRQGRTGRRGRLRPLSGFPPGGSIRLGGDRRLCLHHQPVRPCDLLCAGGGSLQGPPGLRGLRPAQVRQREPGRLRVRSHAPPDRRP